MPASAAGDQMPLLGESCARAAFRQGADKPRLSRRRVQETLIGEEG